jgi:hypothetical protein
MSIGLARTVGMFGLYGACMTTELAYEKNSFEVIWIDGHRGACPAVAGPG